MHSYNLRFRLFPSSRSLPVMRNRINFRAPTRVRKSPTRPLLPDLWRLSFFSMSSCYRPLTLSVVTFRLRTFSVVNKNVFSFF
jgi:hypothetical protein